MNDLVFWLEWTFNVNIYPNFGYDFDIYIPSWKWKMQRFSAKVRDSHAISSRRGVLVEPFERWSICLWFRDPVEEYFCPKPVSVGYPSAIIPGIIRQMPKDRKTRKREEDRGEEKGRNRQRVVSSVGKVDTWPARSSKVSSMLTDLSIGSPRTISLSIPFRFFDSLKFFPSTWTSLLLLQLDREIGTSSQNRRSSPFMRFFF